MQETDNIQNIIIRRANPDYEEGLVFAKLYDITAEGFFSKMLGKEAYEIIAEAFVKPDNEYSYQNTAFAVKEDEICAMVSGYTYEMKKQFDKNIITRSVNGKRANIRLFNFVSFIMSKAMGVKHPGEYYLQAIIVDEDYRGMGLGKILMKWVENEAEEQGARRLSLDVSSKNRTAIALYQRQNMSVDSIWPHLPLIPSVFTRMSKKL